MADGSLPPGDPSFWMRHVAPYLGCETPLELAFVAAVFGACYGIGFGLYWAFLIATRKIRPYLPMKAVSARHSNYDTRVDQPHS